MNVSREEVLKIAALAELEVDEEALPALADQMSRILEYVAQIGGVAGSETAKPFLECRDIDAPYELVPLIDIEYQNALAGLVNVLSRIRRADIQIPFR